eukprot:TRINITY_DN129_c1_g1_i1.p1 TRINITY_DN129_c1_g1~~TRINITY_DN129_c1_g1_i1.p1  ORF type:complete len:302 (-),score=35.77 TRINITY_DN129_c1_g1_i1:61-966(-)
MHNYRAQHGWISKLFTSEDPQNLHKTLGIVCLVSFLYRYFYLMMYQQVEYLGFAASTVAFSVFTVLVHFALSASSIIFHVLKKRIIKKPMIIWEEYRLHSILFTGRACLISLYGLWRPCEGTIWENVHLFGIYLAISLAVDEVSRRYGSPALTTVRNDGDVRPLYTLILRGYSFYQFSAVAAHITPSVSIASMGWNAIIAIQSSAFLMTLYRKGLIEYYTHGIVYSLCLLLSMFHMWQVFPEPLFWFRVLVAFVMRTKFGFSKYFCWAIFAVMTLYPFTVDYDTFGFNPSQLNNIVPWMSN